MSEKPHGTPQHLRHTGDEQHLLREVIRVHQALIGWFARDVGMPASRFALLRLLGIDEVGEVGILELARRLGVNAAAVTRQVQELEGDGLVTRRSDARDKRRSLIRLTAKGTRLFARLHERAHEFEESLVAELGTERLADAARALTHIREALEGRS
jgi:DNA-binding MarR family transcriptional regulator